MIDARDFKAAADALERQAFGELAGDVLGPTLTDAGDLVTSAVKARARRHRRSGRLEAQISSTTVGDGLDTRIRVRAGGRIAPIIVGGSRPHEIRAVRSRALRMLAPGGRLIGFARAIRHPGTRPDPFVAEGIADARGDISAEVDRAGDRLVSELAGSMTRRA